MTSAQQPSVQMARLLVAAHGEVAHIGVPVQINDRLQGIRLLCNANVNARMTHGSQVPLSQVVALASCKRCLKSAAALS